MISMIALAAATAAAPISSPPPMITPSAPPPIVAVPAAPRRMVQAPVLVAVEVFVGDKTLWTGTMRVNAGLGARYSMNFNEGPAVSCGDAQYYLQSEETALNVQLRLASFSETGPKRIAVNTTWSRPVQPASCSRSGQLSAQINQSVELDEKVVELQGDGGLRVRLTLK